MSSDRQFNSIAAAMSAIKRDVKRTDKRLRTAVRRAAKATVPGVIKNMPVAFGGLKGSVHLEAGGDTASVVADAPHAAAVEVGSRPHTPPLAPLVAWVRLRGMQGINTGSRDKQGRFLSKQEGTTTRAAAARVASQLAGMQHRGPGGYSDVDNPTKIAIAIQKSIATYGTKPHHYMKQSVPYAYDKLATEVQKVLGSASE